MVRLDDAKKDFEPLGDFTISPKFLPASAQLAQVNELLALRPAHQYLVQQDGKVLFRVYSSEDDDFLHAVLDALPQGYRAASAFTGLQTDDVPIFVFNTAHFADFTAFFGKLSGKPVRTWFRSVTLSGSITVSQKSETGQPRAANDPKMVRTLSHEMTHQLIRGLLGNRTPMPNWFTEGIAQVCEGLAAPEVYTQNDKLMQKLVAQNAILPLNLILSNNDFHDTVDAMRAGTQKGSPYAQGLHMTRYLVTLLGKESVPEFLQAIAQKGSFEAALQATTGLNMEQFYAAWVASLAPLKTEGQPPMMVFPQGPGPLPPTTVPPTAVPPAMLAPAMWGINEIQRCFLESAPKLRHKWG